MHGQAAAACKQTPPRCDALLVCSEALIGAMERWQDVTKARALGEPESEATGQAMLAEGQARILCAGTGVR